MKLSCTASNICSKEARSICSSAGSGSHAIA